MNNWLKSLHEIQLSGGGITSHYVLARYRATFDERWNCVSEVPVYFLLGRMNSYVGKQRKSGVCVVILLKLRKKGLSESTCLLTEVIKCY